MEQSIQDIAMERGQLMFEMVRQTKINPDLMTSVKSIFSFPGGRRFHFSDPNGNEYAVWSDIDA